MNYTENYRLPQWEKSDRILMDDFNQMCRNIESGINGAVRHGDDAANQAAGAAAEAAKQAQATADSALSAANAAQSAANQAYRPGYAPYAVGTYTGNGGTLSLFLGFQPRFVIITCQAPSAAAPGGDVAAAGPADSLGACVKRTSTGLELVYLPNSVCPYVNQANRTYSYIAFR